MSDISTGYSFTPGEINITDAKLNQAVNSATINTSFYTGKGATGLSPAKATTKLLVYDTAAAVYKQDTLANIIFDSAEFVVNRAVKASPTGAEQTLVNDGGTLKQVTITSSIGYNTAHTAPIGADKIPIYDTTASAIKYITCSTLINGAVAKAAPALGDSVAIYDLAGTAYKKTSVQNIFDTTYNALTTKATLKDNDLVQLYDVTGAAAKKSPITALQPVYTGVDAGGTDAYAITANITPVAYFTGMVVVFKANTANTGACSLNVNALGVKSIKKAVSVDLSDADIAAGQWVTVIYDGTNFQLQNPIGIRATALQAIPASGTATLVAHGLGFVPRFMRWVVVNNTAAVEAGYAQNDEVEAFAMVNTVSGGQSLYPFADGTNVGMEFISTNFGTGHKTTGALTGITTANWRFKCYYT